jgi:hypothetical protein
MSKQQRASFVPGHLIYEQARLAIELSLEHDEELERWQAQRRS